jgi:hypothetical protein
MRSKNWLPLLALCLVISPILQAETSKVSSDLQENSVSLLTIPNPVAGEVRDATVQITLDRDLNTGASIIVCAHWRQNPGLQVDDPTNAAYVSISAPVGAGFRSGTIEREGIYGGLESYALCPTFELVEGQITSGSEVVLGISQLRLPIRAIDEFRLQPFVSDGVGEDFVAVATKSVKLLPGRRAAISAKADSLVGPGETVNVLVRQEDQHGNLVSESGQSLNMSLDLLINGVFFRRVPVNAPVTRIAGISFEVPGTYTIEFRSGGGGLRATANPVVVQQDGHRLLWADFGSTSTYSDGDETPEELIAEAAGRFDLVLLADHDGSSPAQQIDDVTSSDNRQIQSAGGDRHSIRHEDGRTVDVAVSEQPTDIRYLTPDTLRLVQVVTGHGRHLWMADRVLRAGYQPGFIGTNHSHQYPRDSARVSTAIIIKPGESWFDALAAGQTYVTLGRRMVIQTETGRLDPLKPLSLSVTVDAPVPVDRIEVYHNGKLVSRTRGDVADFGAILLTLESSSRPAGQNFSRPRNAREWIGYITTMDTTLSADGLHDWQVLQGGNARRIDFLVRTQGNSTSLPIRMEAPVEDSVLEVVLAEGFEDAAWLPSDRLPQPIPAQRFFVPLAEIATGAVREISVNGYQDTVRVHRPESLGRTTTRFNYQDEQPPALGDYFYFQVVLVDGSYGLTSPRMVR